MSHPPPTLGGMRKLSFLIAPLLLFGLFASAHAGDAGPPPPAVTTDIATPTAPAPDTAVVTVTPDGDVTATPDGAVDRALKDPTGLLTEIARGIRDGNGWRYAAAGVLVLLMALGIKYQVRIFGKTKRARAIMVLVFSAGGAAFATLATPIPLNAKLVLGAVGLTWTAVGGRAWLKAFLWPDDGATEWAPWLKPWLGAK